MIGIIVTGHGGFATGLESNVKVLAGQGTELTAIDFEEGMAVEQLDEKLTAAYDKYKDCDGILVLCDMAGGTPYSRAAQMSADRPAVRIIGGANAPMLLELAMHNVSGDEIDDVDETADDLVFSGSNGITKYEYTPGADF